MLSVLHATDSVKISGLIVLADRLTLDYAHSRVGIYRNISYPWGGAVIGPYPEMGIGKNII
jgi:hypothetical protein